MRAWPYMPGVPAAGHITSRGGWHPGRIEGCVKCEPVRWERCRECGREYRYPHLCREHMLCGRCHP